MNFGSWEVITPTSSSVGLKSTDRTVDRHEMAVCVERERDVLKNCDRKEKENKLNIPSVEIDACEDSLELYV